MITWSPPLDLKVLENKQNGTTNSSKLGADQAIVILGVGRRSGAIEYPQYQNQNIPAGVMERVRYGVTLSQATHLPILLIGGASVPP